MYKVWVKEWEKDKEKGSNWTEWYREWVKGEILPEDEYRSSSGTGGPKGFY